MPTSISTLFEKFQEDHLYTKNEFLHFQIGFNGDLLGSWYTYGELRINTSRIDSPEELYVVNQSAIATCYRAGLQLKYHNWQTIGTNGVDSFKNAPIQCKLESYLIMSESASKNEFVNNILSRVGNLQNQRLGYIVLFETNGLKRTPFFVYSSQNRAIFYRYSYKEHTDEQQKLEDILPIYNVKNWTRIGNDCFNFIPSIVSKKYRQI